MIDGPTSNLSNIERKLRLNATSEKQLLVLQAMLAQAFPNLPDVDQRWALGRMTHILNRVLDRQNHTDLLRVRHGARRLYEDARGSARRKGYAMLFFSTEYEDLKDPATGRYGITTRELMVYDLPLYRALRQWCYHRGVSLTDLLTDARRRKSRSVPISG